MSADRTPNTEYRTPNTGDRIPDEKPPVLGSWKTIYWVVIVFLFVQILLYHLLTITLQ